MDQLAKENNKEHNKVRIAKVARAHYKPYNWKQAKLKVSGLKNTKALAIGQALKLDLKTYSKKKAPTIGFVTTKTFETLMGKIKTLKEIWISETVENITIGCDPEFVITENNGTPIWANSILDDPNETDILGADKPNVELRPPPAETVSELIDNIKTILSNTELTKKIQNYKWLGGAGYKHHSNPKDFILGGHLHFGLPKIPGHTWTMKDSNSLISQKQVIRILDELVGMPLVRIDTPNPKKRREWGYGKFGGMTHSDFKIEWRVPSGLWLIHPELAYAVIGVSKAVVEECWKRLADNNFAFNFMNTSGLTDSFKCIDSDKVREVINSAAKDSISKDNILKTQKILKGMSTYSLYKAHIDKFCHLCKSAPTFVGNQLDLKRGWLEGKGLN